MMTTKCIEKNCNGKMFYFANGYESIRTHWVCVKCGMTVYYDKEKHELWKYKSEMRVKEKKE